MSSRFPCLLIVPAAGLCFLMTGTAATAAGRDGPSPAEHVAAPPENEAQTAAPALHDSTDNGNPRSQPDGTGRDAQEGGPINYGFVIVDGRYLPPPYVVARQGEQILINGEPFDKERLANGLQRRRGRNGRKRRSQPLESDDDLETKVERFLLNDGMAVRFPDGAVGTMHDGYSVVSVLLSEERSDAKLRTLMTDGPQRITSAQWSSLIEGFEVTDDLRTRFESDAAAWNGGIKESGSGSGRTMNYVLTVLGMLLAALAFGVVLGGRPSFGSKWSECNGSRESVQLVVRCVILIGLLSVFDLACTAIASHTVGFWELNPFGAIATTNPAVLVAFKLAFTLAGILILFKFRLYHGTQVASWWLCLILALVTARWVMFNSLLLA